MPAGGHPDWLRPEWDAPGVGALMTTRAGGISEGAFESMNLRDGLGDSPAAVVHNQAVFAAAIGARPALRYRPSVCQNCAVRWAQWPNVDLSK